MATKPARGLIIAIEDYPKAEGLSKKLEGSNAAARDFYNWLVKVKDVPAANIAVCCSEPLAEEQTPAGTTLSDIADTVSALLTEGKDKTSDLFFFYSGHGFCWQKTTFIQATDVMVASDFRNAKLSGRLCFEFSELRELLRLSLGGKQHFFFTDACRTILKEGDIRVGSLGLAMDRAIQGTPEIYTMFSTPVGEAAFTDSGFAPALLKGLQGDGHAKGWFGSRMYVKFDNLRDYIRHKTESGVDGSGDGVGLIYELAGPVTTPCEIIVEDALATDQFQVKVSAGLASFTFDFIGKSTKHDIEPLERGYIVAVSSNGSVLSRVGAEPDEVLDFFEPTTLRFKKGAAVRGGRPHVVIADLPSIDLSVKGVPDASIRVRRAIKVGDIKATGVAIGSSGKGRIKLKAGRIRTLVHPGDYIAEVMHDGVRLAARPFSVFPGGTHIEAFDVAPSNWLLDEIRHRLPDHWEEGVRESAKQLGASAAMDVSLWTALLGAAEIVNPTTVAAGGLGLDLLKGIDLKAGVSVLAVLGALSDSKKARIAIGPKPVGDWRNMEPVQSLRGLFRFVTPQERGPQIVSIALPDRPAWTFSTFALPNRASMLVLAEDVHGDLSVRQFLLPIRSLFKHLPDEVYRRLDQETARMVRLICRQESRFESRKTLEVTADDASRWNELLHAKWLDPLLTLIAAHEIVRKGQVEAERGALVEVEKNMNRYFGGMPDNLVLSALLGKETPPPDAAPILRESLMSLAGFWKVLPFPRDLLDHNSMWVCWRGAVSDAKRRGATAAAGGARRKASPRKRSK